MVEETKARSWVEAVEYAVVRLASGERALVRGGPLAVEFFTNEDETRVWLMKEGSLVEVRRIFFHTHPRVTGPSEDDLRILKILGQTRFYIFEIGDPDGTLVRPKE